MRRRFGKLTPPVRRSDDGDDDDDADGDDDDEIPSPLPAVARACLRPAGSLSEVVPRAASSKRAALDDSSPCACRTHQSVPLFLPVLPRVTAPPSEPPELAQYSASKTAPTAPTIAP